MQQEALRFEHQSSLPAELTDVQPIDDSTSTSAEGVKEGQSNFKDSDEAEEGREEDTNSHDGDSEDGYGHSHS